MENQYVKNYTSDVKNKCIFSYTSCLNYDKLLSLVILSRENWMYLIDKRV